MKKKPKKILEVPKSGDMENLISQAEAAQIRGVTREAISDLVRRGRLRSVKIGGHTLLYRDEVESFVKARAGRKPRG